MAKSESQEGWNGNGSSDALAVAESHEAFNDGCYKFESSVAFFVILVLVGISFGTFAVVLFRNRRNRIFFGFDVLYFILFISGIVRLCSNIQDNLIGNTYGFEFSQTSCKLAAFSSVGMGNVVSFVVFCLVVYAWVGAGLFSRARGTDFNDLDKALTRHLGWFVLFLFALEGATGFLPAVMIDGGLYCGTSGKWSLETILSAHYTLTIILPFLLPFVLMIYPIVRVWRNLSKVEDEVYRSASRTILIVSTTYIATHSPLTFIRMVLFPFFVHNIYLGNIDWVAVCISEGVFKFIQDFWFVCMPLVILARDPELDIPGRSKISALTSKLRLNRYIRNQS